MATARVAWKSEESSQLTVSLTGKCAVPQEVPPPDAGEPSQGSRGRRCRRHGSWTQTVQLAASGKTLQLPAPSGKTLRLSGKTLRLPATGSGNASDAPSGAPSGALVEPVWSQAGARPEPVGASPEPDQTHQKKLLPTISEAF